ncbi:MAG: hypothetical protein LUQ42_04775 [Methanomicrobiales archaeon]|jgi:hypothetical protein|nr:hypothetical protein [Methanomicrobiales archaeon]MDD1645993.1 hypothetical protein [Methanomicrobiales archaeon]MDD1646808.1 hypothetical protein [Methanomicrobiales archaeon]MDD1648579.1 hypothetical protein [Methanomicrobiales archaeon]
MEGIEVKVQKRAFPSKGRVRVHTSLLADLALETGAHVEVDGGSGKALTLGAFADSMVAEGVVRMDPEDMKKLGVEEGAVVVVRRAKGITEKVKKGTKETTEKVTEGAKDVGGKVAKGAGSAAESVKKGAGSAAESVKKGASSAATTVKKTVSPKDKEL